jgi:hypothetical protein
MRRAHKMCTHIAEEQAQLEAIDQKPPDWTAGKKKRTLNRSSKQREETRKGQDRGVARARLTNGEMRYSRARLALGVRKRPPS